MDAGYGKIRRGPSVAGEDGIRVLAEATVLGLPIERILRSRDGDELAVYEAIRLESINVLDELMTALARKIVYEQSQAQKRGEKKG